MSSQPSGGGGAVTARCVHTATVCWPNGHVSHSTNMVFKVERRANTQRDSKSPYRKGLWPATGLNLECPKPKCYNCQMMADCKLCIKDMMSDLQREKGSQCYLRIWTEMWCLCGSKRELSMCKQAILYKLFWEKKQMWVLWRIATKMQLW